MAFILKRKTTLFIAICNGRTDICHIDKTQKIILINLTNKVL